MATEFVTSYPKKPDRWLHFRVAGHKHTNLYVPTSSILWMSDRAPGDAMTFCPKEGQAWLGIAGYPEPFVVVTDDTCTILEAVADDDCYNGEDLTCPLPESPEGGDSSPCPPT